MHPHHAKIVTLALALVSIASATAAAQDLAPRGAVVGTGAPSYAGARTQQEFDELNAIKNVEAVRLVNNAGVFDVGPLIPSLPSYSYASSSPFAGGISSRTARLTPPAFVGDTSTSSTHRTRNTILGAVIGLVAGAYIGGRIGAKAQPCGGHECEGPPLGQVGDGIVGGLIGLAVGVVVGTTASDRM